MTGIPVSSRSSEPHVLRDPWRILRVLCTVLLVLVVSVALLFPIGARAYTQKVIEGLGSGVGVHPVVQVPNGTKKIDGLGIRNMPLMNEESLATVRANDPQRGIEAGQALFGSQWETIYNTANAYRSPAASWARDGDDPVVVSTRELIRPVLQNLGSDKIDQIVQTMSLLMWYGDIQAVPEDSSVPSEWGQITVAQAMAHEMRDLFDTCDANLQVAYFFDLLEEEWDQKIQDEYEALYDKAIQSCGPEDPTPAILKVQYMLQQNSRSTSVGYSGIADPIVGIRLRNGEIDELDKWAKQLMLDHPTVPAAMLTAGDIYRYLAVLAKYYGFGPFTIKQLNEKAASAYETGVKLSTQPAIRYSLAKIYNQLGRYEDAETLLKNADIISLDGARSTLSEALARSGDFSAAADEAMNTFTVSVNDTGNDDSAAIAIHRSVFTDIDSDNQILTTADNSRALHMYIQRGASAGVENAPWYPEYRADQLWLLSSEAEQIAIQNNIEYTLSTSNSLPNSARQAAEQYVKYSFLAGEYDEAARYCPTDEFATRSTLCWIVKEKDNTNPGIGSMADAIKSFDGLQNLWRIYGNLDKAQAVLENVGNTRFDSFADNRLAEIAYLRKDYARAAQLTTQSLEATGTWLNCGDKLASGGYDLMSGVLTTMLRNATALRLVEQYDSAEQVLSRVLPNAQQCGAEALGSRDQYGGYAGNGEIERFSSYVALERAQIAYAQKDYVTAYEQAVQSSNDLQAYANSLYEQPRRGASEQLASVSAFANGDYAEATKWAQQAMKFDPWSPLYQEALADAQRGTAGDVENEGDDKTVADRTRLMSAYQQALQTDDSLFSSWNNLGVLQAQAGDMDAAFDSFKRAVAARNDYAIGWFNLGTVASERQGFSDFVLSQGALGKAGLLDKNLKDQAPVLRFDNEVYQSGVDVSKDIPDDWQLAQTMRRNPVALAAGLSGIVVARVLYGLFQDKFSEKFTEHVIPWLGSGSSGAGGPDPEPSVDHKLKSRVPTVTPKHLTTPKFERPAWMDNPVVTRILAHPWLTAVVSFLALLLTSEASGTREYAIAGVGIVALLVIPVVAANGSVRGANPIVGGRSGRLRWSL